MYKWIKSVLPVIRGVVNHVVCFYAKDQKSSLNNTKSLGWMDGRQKTYQELLKEFEKPVCIRNISAGEQTRKYSP